MVLLCLPFLYLWYRKFKQLQKLDEAKNLEFANIQAPVQEVKRSDQEGQP